LFLLSSTGAILVEEELDYELKKSYDLTVTATDFQTGAYSDTIVHIDLEVNSKYSLNTKQLLVKVSSGTCLLRTLQYQIKIVLK
jgi:hypothetical protein